MKTGEARIVFSTAPDQRRARQLARGLLERRLAACINIVPGLESHYWWEGKIERGPEVLMVIKTSKQQLKELERALTEEHPYETPEFLAIAVESGSERYLKWLLDSVGSGTGRRAKTRAVSL